jgi:hypothetical protein
MIQLKLLDRLKRNDFSFFDRIFFMIINNYDEVYKKF